MKASFGACLRNLLSFLIYGIVMFVLLIVAGLGVLTFDEQAENWRTSLARVRAIVGEWGIEFPAIPELDLDGVDVGHIGPEDIIPVF